MSRSHILFINEFYHPDLCASAAVLADRLPRIRRLRPDWDITVIAGNRAWDRPDVVYPAEDEHEGVRIVRVARPALQRASLARRALGFAAFQRGALAAARRLTDMRLVVGTTAPPQGAWIAQRIARRFGCPFIYGVLDLYPDLAATLGRLRPGSLTCRAWHARDVRVMRAACAVVSIAGAMTQRIGRTRRIDPAKCVTIHDGFDPALVAPPTVDAVNDFARMHNPRGRFVVQYAGNMGLSHPFDTILAAARDMAGDDVLFQFIGDGPQRTGLAAALPAGAQLLAYEPAARLWEVLGTADACLISQHPQMFDQALPYKIYGILAASRPAIFIGNPQSEIAAWLAEAGAGYCIEHGDVDGLVSAIHALKADRAEARAMGARGRALLDASLTAERAARAWVELIAHQIDS